MNRIARRTIFWIVCLSLGWYVAGVSLHASDETHSDHAAAAFTHAPAHDEAHPHDDPAVDAAKALRVPRHETASWYPRVITGAVLLFGAAALLGPFALRSQPTEPQEEDDHGHDDHGH
jgi:hypothetical protein